MAVKKGGLGKGLDSLIPKKEVGSTKPIVKEIVSASDKEEKNHGEIQVKLSMVEPNPDQPRKHFDEDAILELSESIKQHGVIQPLIVQRKNDRFEIIAGERRWRAAREAGLKEVPVIIKEYSKQKVVEIALIENIQRENLNPIEEALAYKSLLTEYNLKQDEVAERVSKSRTTVTNTMRLLKLDERVQQMIVDEMLTTGHARALLAVEDQDNQYKLAMKIFDEKLSVREVENMIKALKKPKKEPKIEEKLENAFIYEDIENVMKNILGTKVNIKHKNNKGKIEIEYYSEEELERIFDLLKMAKEN